MSDGLTNVGTSFLQEMLAALRSGAIKTPIVRSDLIGFGAKEQLETLVRVFEGLSCDACTSVIEVALSERARADHPMPELVWTGPDTEHATARDTAVVLRELFESARRRVVLAGYSFLNAESVLRPLHEVMTTHDVSAHLFIDIEQVKAGTDADAHAQSQLTGFIKAHWLFGPPFPALYCDRRALTPPPPYSSLHAKCVAVDCERALVSSANFTLRGQERNVETGVLLRDPSFASHLDRQWMRLVEAGLVTKWRGHDAFPGDAT